MPLYDSYQLANSTRVPIYQGSTVPEIAQVAQQAQQQYDTAQAEQDYVTRFMNSMQTLPSDRGAFQEWSGQYRNKLKALASRPDLENTLRETSMLAQDVPQGYAPFAQRMKDYQTYQDQLNKAAEAGDITPDTARGMLAMSLKSDKGIQKDPYTGQYVGRFTGLNYVKDLDPNALVDTWLKNAAPESQGWETTQVGDKWIVHNKVTGETMTPAHIQQIISQASAGDPTYQAWVKQRQQLGTYRDDYTHFLLGDPGGQLGEIISEARSKGLDPSEVLRSLKQQQIAGSILQGMQNYGVLKYTKRPSTSQTLSANPYGVADYKNQLKNTVPAIAGTILQPTPASIYSSPGELGSKIAELGQGVTAAQDGYNAWVTQNGVTKKGNQWFDADGNEVTGEAQKWIDMQQQAATAKAQLEARQQKAMKEANYKITPEMEAKAAAQYQLAMKNGTEPSSTPGYQARPIDPITREKVAQNAYEEALSGSDPVGYRRYKNILAKDAAGDSVPVGITTFTNKKLNQQVTDMFNGLNVNLGSGNNSLAANGVSWATGDKAGQQLSAGDYKNMIGKAQFVGTGIDTDGNYKMYFKVGSAKTDAKGKPVGKDILVKMDAYPGIAQNLVNEGLTTNARQYLMQNLSQVVGNGSGSGSIPVNEEGDKIGVRRVTASEKELGYVAPGTEYILSYPLPNGTFKQVPASSLDEAANSITQVLQQAAAQSNQSKSSK